MDFLKAQIETQDKIRKDYLNVNIKQIIHMKLICINLNESNFLR